MFYSDRYSQRRSPQNSGDTGKWCNNSQKQQQYARSFAKPGETGCCPCPAQPVETGCCDSPPQPAETGCCDNPPQPAETGCCGSPPSSPTDLNESIYVDASDKSFSKRKNVRFRDEQLEDVRVFDDSNKDLFGRKVFPLWGCNFKEYTKEKDVVLVLFHGEIDDVTKGTIEQFNLASKVTQGKNHAYAHVDCLEERELCKKERIKQTPTFKMYFSNGMAGSIKEPAGVTACKLKKMAEDGMFSFYSPFIDSD